MKEIELSEQILADIVDNDVEFSEALRKVFQSNVDLRPHRAMVAGLVGCTLRHNILLNYLLRPYEDLTAEESRFVSICLANVYFYKRISIEDIKAEFLARLGEEKAAKIAPLLEKGTEEDPLMPADIKKTSNHFLSLRYNTPEWVLKIWQHFGYGNTYKILRHNSRPAIPSVRLRDGQFSEEEFLANHPDFHPTSVKGIYTYSGKTPLRKEPLFQKGVLFLEKPATKFIIDSYKVSMPQEALVYTDNRDSSILKEMVATYGSELAMNLGVDDLDKYLDFKRMLKAGDYHNVNFFAAESDSMLSAISRPQDLVIALPDSSNFDRIRETPDYLLHFKREQMDAIIAKEKKILEDCSVHVAEKGLLIYLVYTISMKEGRNTVNEFLANHPEFHYVKDEQHFPFDEYETSFYYCVMQKDTLAEKLPDPIVAAASIQESETASMRATEAEANN